jgi:hypothetical protein
MFGRVQGGRVYVAVTGATGTVEHQYRLSPGLGWALVSPMPRPVGRYAAALSLMWVALLWIPFGFYSRASIGRRADGRSGERLIPAAVVTVAGGVAAALGMFVTPAMTGVPIPGPAEWLGLAAGILVGAILSVAAGRLSPPVERER